MSKSAGFKVVIGMSARGSLAGLLFVLLAVPACGSGMATSGGAVGKIGRGVAAKAHAVPQGAQVCAMQEALAASPGTPDKPIGETCNKAVKSDQLWRRAMIVLGAYGDKIEAVASGQDAQEAGNVEVALAAVRGAEWVQVEPGPEQSARDAVTQLVNQMSAPIEKKNLEKAISDAAPHVKTVCDGLHGYLETQVRSLDEVQKEIEKRRASRNTRRCGMLDNRPICVSDSVVDRLVYANVFGQIALLTSSHMDAQNASAAFCAVHRKLEEAAATGQLSKPKTYSEIVETIKSTPQVQPQAETVSAQKPAEEAKPAAGAKPAPPDKK